MTIQDIKLPDFSKINVLVYGDVMLDRYYHGDATRISPEAPVPVVNISRVETRPGGAANVAQNIAALGANVILCGLVGDDAEANELRATLTTHTIDCQFQVTPNYTTITKLRVMGQHQQLIRMDFEHINEKSVDDELLFHHYCNALERVDMVVLSDYSKGALTHVESLIAAANRAKKPVLIDPKHKEYQRYSGATVITPNLKEFEAAVGPCEDFSALVQKAQRLIKKIRINGILITLGKDGMVYIQSGIREAMRFQAQARDVFDVTGAGDTVIGVLAAGLAAGMQMPHAIELSNLAAGVVVGRLGAHSVTTADLQQVLLRAGDLSAGITPESQLLQLVFEAKKRGEKIVMTNGCFDVLHVGHVDYLSQAKALGHRLIVAVNDDDSVRRLKGDARPINPLWARMKILSALSFVDWVVPFSENTPQRLVELLSPDILVKGGDYQIEEIAGSTHVLEKGGRVLTIPLVSGFSTTAMLERITS